MHLKLRNAVADAILAALGARTETAGLAALAAALAPDGAVLERARARHLITSGAFAAAGDGRIVVRPALAVERAAALARVEQGRAVVERFWSEEATRRPPERRSGRAPGAADERDALDTALSQAALLFNTGLFFEVHEVLEAVWHRLTGEARRFVQGLIQIAVALHHMQHGNHVGARSLFRAGREKLAPHVPEYLGVEVAELLAGIRPWECKAETETSAPDPPAPVLRRR